MVFCNVLILLKKKTLIHSHNPYFNRWFSAIKYTNNLKNMGSVTILILIDGFLQFGVHKGEKEAIESHNPYFNRWFSAMQKIYLK